MAFLVPLILPFILSESISLGLSLISGLAGGQSSHGQKIKDKRVRSNAYQSNWPRCRGITKLRGEVIWSTNVIETIRKSVSGLFGSNSFYYYTYAVSMAVGFGKKIGGGAAGQYLTIWADDKQLWSSQQPGVVVTGSITMGLNQPAGTTAVAIDLAAGAQLVLPVGTIVLLGTDTADYVIQEPVNLTGPTSGTLSIFPGLTRDFDGGLQITVPGSGPQFATPEDQYNSNPDNPPQFPWDVSSFDPNAPHDGSHIDSIPSEPGVTTWGHIRFYLGSDDQQPDFAYVEHMGAGNVPAYRGTAYVYIGLLQLANYGNRPPTINALIDWENAAPQGSPMTLGPVSSANTVGLGAADTFAADITLKPNSLVVLAWHNTDTFSEGNGGLSPASIVSQQGLEFTHRVSNENVFFLNPDDLDNPEPRTIRVDLYTAPTGSLIGPDTITATIVGFTVAKSGIEAFLMEGADNPNPVDAVSSSGFALIDTTIPADLIVAIITADASLVLQAGGDMTTLQLGNNYLLATIPAPAPGEYVIDYAVTGGNFFFPVAPSVAAAIAVRAATPPPIVGEVTGNVSDADIVSSLMVEAGYDASQFDASRLTTEQRFIHVGIELDKEPRRDSIRRLMESDLFDSAETDGKVVYVPRGGAVSITIPEDDLGAQAEVGKAEPRLTETLQLENDIPESMWVGYFDAAKLYEQAKQYQKRISQPYADDLVNNQKVTNSRTQLDIQTQLSDNATPMKQRAEMVLYDKWSGRFGYDFKLPPKHMRIDPTDVVRITYKGETLEMRLAEADRGASLAQQFKAVSSDSGVYSSVAVSDSGTGSGSPPVHHDPPPSATTDVLFSSPADDIIDVVAPVGAEAGFTQAHTLAYTPQFAVILGYSAGNGWFDGSRYDATNLYLMASAQDVHFKVATWQTAPEVIVDLAPTADGHFAVPHTLGAIPGMVLRQSTSGGNIWPQATIADIGLVYFTASLAGVTGKAALYRVLTGSASPAVNHKRVPITNAPDGAFVVPHGLGATPLNVFPHTNTPGFPDFWFDDSSVAIGYDDVNVYLVSPGAGVSGYIDILYS